MPVGEWVEADPAEIEKMMQLPQDDWLNLTLMGHENRVCPSLYGKIKI